MLQKKQNPTGELVVQARGKPYRLHFGMSVIAELQAKHGDKLESILTMAETDGLLDMSIIVDIFIGALQRYHADEADRWLVDDITSENQNLLPSLMRSSFPDPIAASASSGNGVAAAWNWGSFAKRIFWPGSRLIGSGN